MSKKDEDNKRTKRTSGKDRKKTLITTPFPSVEEVAEELDVPKRRLKRIEKIIDEVRSKKKPRGGK